MRAVRYDVVVLIRLHRSRAASALLMGAATAMLIWTLRQEDHSPLRQTALPRSRRQATNLILGIGSLLMAGRIQRALLTPLFDRRTERRGVVQSLPARWRRVAAFLLLDWSIYWWHRASHRIPPLWRLHRVHHVDLDLDMSTAIRFHFAEQLLSAPVRAAMILLIGPDARTHALWNRFFFASILFHHANIRLPATMDRILSLLLTTPRMHGIHHMARRDLTDSNWTSGLSLWDRLHGSFRADVAPDAVRVGVPAYTADLGSPDLLMLPMAAPSAADWRAPSSR